MHLRRLHFAVVAPALVVIGTLSAEAQTVIEGASKKVTVACGKSVRVAGLSNEVTLTGICDDVTVEGKSNTVHIATLGRLTLAGSSNRVYWKDGIDGRAPRINRSGTDNLAERRGSTTPLEAPAATSSGRSSGVRIVAEKDKATVSAGTVVVDAEKAGTEKAGAEKKGGASGGRAPSATVPAADVLLFADNREERSVDCRGRAVEITGNRNRLTLRGTCASIRVSGNRNEIDVGSSATIATTGNENTVRYRDLTDDRPPAVVNPGTDNTIRRVSP